MRTALKSILPKKFTIFKIYFIKKEAGFKTKPPNGGQIKLNIEAINNNSRAM